MLNFKHGILLLLIPFFTSCLTYEKTAYLQGNSNKVAIEEFQTLDYQLQKGDIVYVRFVSLDPKTTELFNLSSGQSTSMVSSQSMQLIGYIVSSKGNIDLPFLGPIKAEGLSIYELKTNIKKKLSTILQDGDVIVKHVDKRITLLGGFKAPGIKPIVKEKLTVFEVLSMGGDIDDYGDRTRIHLIRKTSSGYITTSISILNQEALSLSSLIQPNDIIYIDPMKERIYGLGTIPWSLILSSVSTTLLLINFFQN